jgi:hypothetical protein
MTEAERQRRIHRAHARAMSAHASGRTYRAQAWLRAMGRLISARTPAEIAEIERERGLR